MSSEVVCRNVRVKLCDCFAECCLKTKDTIRLNHFLEVVGTSMTNLARKALNISDLREMARRRLTRGLFDFCTHFQYSCFRGAIDLKMKGE